VQRDGMVEALDGPHIGRGATLGLDLPLLRFELQCCVRKPGTRNVITTGNMLPSMVGAAESVKFFVSSHCAEIGHRLGRNDLGPLIPPRCDLHIHANYAWHPTDDLKYSSAIFVALVSLLLGRPPAPDVVVFGNITPAGVLFPGQVENLRPWSVEDVQMCESQGIRRIVLSHRTTIGEEAREAARQLKADGSDTLTFVLVNNILDGLAHVFG
jgi:hypothetical protein